MPNIKTKFTLDGEKEYKAAIREIGDGMRVLDSEMRKVSTAYAQNADSVEALNAKNDVLERQISTQKEKIEKLKEALQQSAQKYGEADKRTMQWQTSLNDAEAELNKLNNQVNENNQKIEETGKKTGNLGEIVSGLTGKFGIQLPDSLKKSMNAMGGINTEMLAVAGGISAVVTVVVKVTKAFVDMTKATAEAAKELETLSSTTSISTDTLQEFEYASEMIGVSTDQIADALKETTNKMQEARDGSEDAAAAYSKLGVTITDANGNLRDAETVFYETIDALKEVKNTTERDAIAMDLLSESAQKLNPLIEIGSEGIATYAKEAREMGYVLDQEAIDALSEVDDGFKRMEKTVEAVTKQLSAEFAPYMEESLGDTADFVKKIGEEFKKSGIVEDFGSILTSVTELLEPLGSLIELLLPAVEKQLQPIAKLMAGIADTANLIVGLVTFDGDKIKTALGWNVSSGQLSNQQKLYYKNALNYNSYTEGSGWSGGGGYIEAGTGKWVPYNAPGTDNWIGGFTTVAENGPERIYLPSGSRVQTASETRYTGGGSTINIERVVIDAKNIKQLNDLVRIFENERITSRMGVR